MWTLLINPCFKSDRKVSVDKTLDWTDSTARKSSLWAQQHLRRYALAKLFHHVLRMSKFANMAGLPREFELNFSPLQQGAICRSLRMSALMTQSWHEELPLYLNPAKSRKFVLLTGVWSILILFQFHLKPLTNKFLFCSWEIDRLLNEIDSAPTL